MALSKFFKATISSVSRVFSMADTSNDSLKTTREGKNHEESDKITVPATQEFNAEELDAEGDYYLSGLFNIETSPGFKALGALESKKEIPEDRFLEF